MNGIRFKAWANLIHITCNMGSRYLPDIYALSPRACGPWASGICIRQISPAHVTTYAYQMGAKVIEYVTNSVILRPS